MKDRFAERAERQERFFTKYILPYLTILVKITHQLPQSDSSLFCFYPSIIYLTTLSAMRFNQPIYLNCIPRSGFLLQKHPCIQVWIHREQREKTARCCRERDSAAMSISTRIQTCPQTRTRSCSGVSTSRTTWPSRRSPAVRYKHPLIFVPLTHPYVIQTNNRQKYRIRKKHRKTARKM